MVDVTREALEEALRQAKQRLARQENSVAQTKSVIVGIEAALAKSPK